MEKTERPQYPIACVNNTEFQRHVMTEEGVEQTIKLSHKFDELLTYCRGMRFGGNARELALTATKLEEACFFATKALAKRFEKK